MDKEETTCCEKISEKQLEILKFPFLEKNYTALICDGAVRSGKSMMMIVAFILWAMTKFNNQSFAICGKTVSTAVRNLIIPIQRINYLSNNFKIIYQETKHQLLISSLNNEVTNIFYVFGGKDEASYSLIQGCTLAGVFFDEVVLMPQSFVNQAMLRCSVEGSKFFFNCNPAEPMHWFNQEWVLKAHTKNALHLHFVLDDNPSLTPAMKERYKSNYTGVYYLRYILGLWAIADGAIYPMFDTLKNTYEDVIPGILMRSTRTITIDYGTTNPCVFLEIFDDGEKIRVEREFTWDSKLEQRQKADDEYVQDFMQFIGTPDCLVLIDPSAASLRKALTNAGIFCVEATNDVNEGIAKTATLLHKGVIQINKSCEKTIASLTSYVWDSKAAATGKEQPIKINDHHADALRYYVNSLPDWRIYPD